MTNLTRISYRLEQGRVRLRPVYAGARKSLVAAGARLDSSGWVDLSPGTAAELQAQHQPADKYDRAVLVVRADLERWLGIAPAPKPVKPRRPSWGRVDWRALAEGIEEALGTAKMRPRILDLLERVGMHRSANPELVAWAAEGVEGAP